MEAELILATYTAATLHYAAKTEMPLTTAIENLLRVRALLVAALFDQSAPVDEEPDAALSPSNVVPFTRPDANSTVQ